MDKATPKPGQWVSVGNVRGVVSYVSEDAETIEIVFMDKKQPTNLNAIRDGNGWKFAPSPDYGGYADRYRRLDQFVAILRQGERRGTA